jgi:phosphocarrier protein
MIEIKYVLTDPLGLHGRPAGLLVKSAAKFKCDIKLGVPGKMVNAKRVIGVMALSIKHGQELVMTFNGEDEEESSVFCKTFLEENL